MSPSFTLSFRKDIAFIEQPETEQVVLQASNLEWTLKQVTPELKTALKTLATSGATEVQLKSLVEESDREKLKLFYHLHKFTQQGWICHSVLADGILLASAVPIAPDYQLVQKEVTSQQKYVLSRFAYCHQVSNQMVLESPLSKAQISLSDWRGAATIAQLSKPQNYPEIAASIPGITEETAQQVVSLLLSTQMLSEVQENGTPAETENLTLTQWEFHDLLFHTRSRKGRHANRVGGTYRFLGKIEPLPAVKPMMSEDIIDLYKPDLEQLKTTDTPFTAVLETRKSMREYGETPISAEQLGEFLYRCGRIKEIRQTSFGEISNRPYPSGGAIYELELYICVNQCQDIPAGLYHYAPKAHQLCKLPASTDAVEELLQDACRSTGQQSMPQILIIIATRFQRLSWKYESIAYALMLKHVGVLSQTMYLVATAMNLAGCAIGVGNSDLFAKAVGTEYYAETSIGEFALGSQRHQ